MDMTAPIPEPDTAARQKFYNAIAKHSIAKPVLDSVSKLPVTISTAGANRMISDQQRFLGTDRLARIVEEPVAIKGGVDQKLVSRFLR